MKPPAPGSDTNGTRDCRARPCIVLPSTNKQKPLTVLAADILPLFLNLRSPSRPHARFTLHVQCPVLMQRATSAVACSFHCCHHVRTRQNAVASVLTVGLVKASAEAQ